MNFGRLYRYIRPPVRDDLDYDLRCLRREGLIRTIPGKLWVIGT